MTHYHNIILDLLMNNSNSNNLPHFTQGSPTIKKGQAQKARPVANTTLQIASMPHLISSQGSKLELGIRYINKVSSEKHNRVIY